MKLMYILIAGCILFVIYGMLLIMYPQLFTRIPEEAQKDIQSSSIRILQGGNLTRWDKELPSGNTFVVFSAQTIENKSVVRFVYKDDTVVRFYTLEDQLDAENHIKTAFVKRGNGAYIIGYVDPTIQGELTFANIERYESNKADWMKGLKSSTIKNRVFIIPIFKEEKEAWNSIVRVAIKTKESLNESVKNPQATGSIWEKKFDPPLDAGVLFEE